MLTLKFPNLPGFFYKLPIIKTKHLKPGRFYLHLHHLNLKIKFYFNFKFKLLLLSFIIMVGFSQCGPSDDKIVFPENLKTYQVSDSISFNPDWIRAEKKLVVVSKGLYAFSIPFMDILAEYDQEMPVIIVITKEDKDEIIQRLTEYAFPYPFIHDPDGLFIEENQLWKRFGLQEKNTIAPFFMEGDYISEIGGAEIGMRDRLRVQLDEFLK